MALGLPTEGAGASRPRPRSGPFPRGGASELLLRGVDGAGVPGIQAYGAAPFEDLQVDLTEMPQCGDLDCAYGSAQISGRGLWLTWYRRQRR
ncbi:uncharacterized protein LOC106996962 isoform X4 [Macaca mulatta]